MKCATAATAAPDGSASRRFRFDSFTTISSLLPGGASTLSLPTVPGDDMDAPWQWGNPVAWDGAGRANVFVIDRGDGEQVVTRVIWTLNEGREREHADRTR